MVTNHICFTSPSTTHHQADFVYNHSSARVTCYIYLATTHHHTSTAILNLPVPISTYQQTYLHFVSFFRCCLPPYFSFINFHISIHPTLADFASTYPEDFMTPYFATFSQFVFPVFYSSMKKTC